MAWLNWFLDALFPDIIIYGLTVLVFFVGFFKCCRPVFRNASALRRATDLLKEGSKAKLNRPLWSDTSFLGKHLMPVWRAFLQSVDMGTASGVSSDVADFVHDDSVINDPGKAALADIIPGLCTSLGILGTFIGLSMGLTGLDVMEVSSYTQLTGGIALAFNTSIVGIIASILFSILHRTAVGRAREALDRFIAAFYYSAVAQPIHPTTQLLAYERQQAGAIRHFARDISENMAGEIHHAIVDSMTPVQHSMEDFLNAATRAQVDGLDFIVTRFIERMNASLDGQLRKLGQALSETASGQLQAQEHLRASVESIGQLTQDIAAMSGMSEQVIAKFTEYVGSMGDAYRDVSDTQADTGALLGEITEASLRQTKYLSALQAYQAKLQESFRDYTVWTDRFVGGLEGRTASQNASLEQIAMEMRASAELLRDAYKGFSASIEQSLAGAMNGFAAQLQQAVAAAPAGREVR